MSTLQPLPEGLPRGTARVSKPCPNCGMRAVCEVKHRKFHKYEK